MALNKQKFMPMPSNYSSVIFGYDQHPKQTAYYQEYMLGRPNTMSFPKQGYKKIPSSMICNHYAKNYLASTAQDDYGRMDPIQTASAYQKRKKELDNIIDFYRKDSVRLDESVPQVGTVPPPKTIQNIDYLSRQHLLPHYAAIQGPRSTPIPFYPYPLQIERIAARQTEYNYRYQWLADDTTGIHQNYFRKRAIL